MPISSTNVQFGVGNSGGSLADRNSITPYYGLDVQLDEESDEGNISESDTSTSYSTSLKFDGSDRQKSSNFSHKDTRFTQPNRNAGGGLLSTVNSAVSLLPEDFDQPIGILEELLME